MADRRQFLSVAGLGGLAIAADARIVFTQTPVAPAAAVPDLILTNGRIHTMDARNSVVEAMSAPRTLAPDALTKSGRKPVVEGFTGDKRVFQDGTRTFEIHVIKGLPHADGLVVGWLPKERLLVYADMFNLPTEATGPVPNPPVVGTQVFAANLERLNIGMTDRIMSVHSLNPDRLTSRAEILKSLGR